jgi:hypothetical protein
MILDFGLRISDFRRLDTSLDIGNSLFDIRYSYSATVLMALWIMTATSFWLAGMT